MNSTLTGKNQVTIPAAIVREMKLAPGTQFEWSVGEKPGTIVMKVKPSVRELLAEIQRLGAQMRLRNPTYDPMAALMAEREADLQLEIEQEKEWAK